VSTFSASRDAAAAVAPAFTPLQDAPAALAAACRPSGTHLVIAPVLR
jgi:hypothetical protein